MRAHRIYKKRRRRNSLRYFVSGMVLAGAAILVVIGGTVFVSGKRPKDEKGSGISENIGVDSDELLTLVNAEHPMPSEWQCELVQLNNGQNIDSRAYEDLQQMMDTARAEGYDPYICSSWRSHETQVRLFEEEIQSYKKQGYSEREAEVQRPSGSQYREPASMNSDLHWISYLWKIKGWKSHRRTHRHSSG